MKSTGAVGKEEEEEQTDDIARSCWYFIFFQFRALLGWWLLMEEVPHSEELELHIPFGFAAICVVWNCARHKKCLVIHLFFQNSEWYKPTCEQKMWIDFSSMVEFFSANGFWRSCSQILIFLPWKHIVMPKIASLPLQSNISELIFWSNTWRSVFCFILQFQNEKSSLFLARQI